ncbi:hypothetical protein LR392_13465 [Arthrobacter sp. AK04]|uniref:hypothetical protein n=1 Tax=Arthrobacter sp. AK04 TaxID=2900048 RepID=UPI001E349CA9|nr:hypothetical protein [Arthrobacter sp. AK04]MCD5343234.1 hypothetical protein [Arthrobacter sp. AK04]
MTQTLERPVTIKATPATAAGTPRGGSYVTLPGHPADSRRTEAGYISLPGGGTRTGNTAQGSYVSLQAVPLRATEISYTRRG